MGTEVACVVCNVALPRFTSVTASTTTALCFPQTSPEFGLTLSHHYCSSNHSLSASSWTLYVCETVCGRDFFFLSPSWCKQSAMGLNPLFVKAADLRLQVDKICSVPNNLPWRKKTKQKTNLWQINWERTSRTWTHDVCLLSNLTVCLLWTFVFFLSVQVSGEMRRWEQWRCFPSSKKKLPFCQVGVHACVCVYVRSLTSLPTLAVWS